MFSGNHPHIKQKTLSLITLFLMVASSFVTCFIGGVKASNQVAYSNNSPTTAGTKANSVLWKFAGRGIPGQRPTMQPQVFSFAPGGANYTVIGTDKGVAIVSLDGTVRATYVTFGPVIGCALISDITGDGQDALVIITLDQAHANVIAIDSNNGAELWSFDTVVTGFSSTTLTSQNYTSYTWAVQAINDINGDGKKDVVVASWNRIYILSGADGSQIWVNDKACTNEIFSLLVMPGINGNEFQEIIAGSENGEVVALNSKTGQISWANAIPLKAYSEQGLTGAVTIKDLPVPVVTMTLIPDLNHDGVQDIAVAGEDGQLRIESGKTGQPIGQPISIYYIKPPTTPLSTSFTGELLTYTDRLFSKSTVELISFPDVTNDGIPELLTIASGLDLPTNSYGGSQTSTFIQGMVLDLSQVAGSGITMVSQVNWSYSEFSQFSYPAVVKVGTDIRFYFYNPSSYQTSSGQMPESVFYYSYSAPIMDPDVGPTIVLDFSQGYYNGGGTSSASQVGTYLVSVSDLTGDGIGELFAIGATGRYFIVDPVLGQTIYMKTLQSGTTKIIPVGDLNGDGVKDFLYTSVSTFSPEWETSSEISNQPTEYITTEVDAINGKTGDVLWTLQMPSAYYDGVRDLTVAGDLNGDGIPDLIGWIIPSRVPQAVKDYITALSGTSTIPSSNCYQQGATPPDVDIYLALLAPYTKVIAINGATGQIFYSQPMMENIYKFYRSATYTGSYENPSMPASIGLNGNDPTFNYIYNRINGVGLQQWYYNTVAGMQQNTQVNWASVWSAATMSHASAGTIENGTLTGGTLFDLEDNQGAIYWLTSTNATGRLNTGISPNSTTAGTTAGGDLSTWIGNSTLDPTTGSSQKLNLEMWFNQSQPMDGDFTNLNVTYSGVLNTTATSYAIYAWNYTLNAWSQISDSGINSTSQVSVSYALKISDFCNKADQNRTRIKLEGTTSSANSGFQAKVDDLNVQYGFTHHAYNLTGIPTFGSNYSVLINFSIPLNFSSDSADSSRESTLTQLQRISSIKIQTQLMLNTTATSFTYQLYNFTSGQWVNCNWSTSDTYWEYGATPFTSLWGSYGGSRTGSSSFSYTPNNYQNDIAWVTTRGTIDAKDAPSSAVEVDYQNRSALSYFVDQTTKMMFVRVNITCTGNPFNVSIDTFSVQPFYWSVVPGLWDPAYVWAPSMNGQPAQFTSQALRDLSVQAFQVINGTGGAYLDVLACVGMEDLGGGCGSFSYNGNMPTYGTVLRLFDVNGNATYSQWSLNCSNIPTGMINALSLNTASAANGWVLTGGYQNNSGTYLSSRLVSNAHWQLPGAHLRNYTDVTVEYSASFNYSVTLGDISCYNCGSQGYIPPGIIPVTKAGLMGIATVEYGTSGLWKDIVILDPVTLNVKSRVPITNLVWYMSGGGSSQRFDFTADAGAPGGYLMLSSGDFNGDGILDHVGIYQQATGSQGFSQTTDYYLRIYSGTDNSSDPQPIAQVTVTLTTNYGSSSIAATSWRSQLPFASVGDINNDGQDELAWGVQGLANQGSIGSKIEIYALKTQTQSEFTLLPFTNIYSYGSLAQVFYPSVQSVSNFTGDGTAALLVQRSTYTRQQYQYVETPVFDLLDVKNQKILMRIAIPADSVTPIGDQNNDFLLGSGNVIYCINSLYTVKFTDLTNNQQMLSTDFAAQWQSEANCRGYELFVDGNSYGFSLATSASLSLGGGSHIIEVYMYDTDGIIVGIATARVVVPGNQAMLWYTLIGLVVIITAAILYRQVKKRRLAKVVAAEKDLEREYANGRDVEPAQAQPKGSELGGDSIE